MISNSKFIEQFKALEHSENFKTIIAFQDYHEGRITKKEMEAIDKKAGLSFDFNSWVKACQKIGEQWRKENEI